jgi:hypothetical protein
MWTGSVVQLNVVKTETCPHTYQGAAVQGVTSWRRNTVAPQWCGSLEDNGGLHEAQVLACTQGELCEASRKNDSQGWMQRILHCKLQHSRPISMVMKWGSFMGTLTMATSTLESVLKLYILWHMVELPGYRFSLWHGICLPMTLTIVMPHPTRFFPAQFYPTQFWQHVVEIFAKPWKFKYMRKNRKFLPQLLLKLVASAAKAICTCLTSKNAYILSNGVGGRRDICKCLHSHKTIFLPQSFCNTVLPNMT